MAGWLFVVLCLMCLSQRDVTGTGLGELRIDILDKINAIRSQHGLGLLQMSYKANQEAQDWANQMLWKNEPDLEPDQYPNILAWTSKRGGFQSGQELMDSWSGKYRDVLLHYFGLGQAHGTQSYVALSFPQIK